MLRKIHHKHTEGFAREGWRRSVGLIVSKMKKYYAESRKKGTSHTQ
jgi:hypothetical protein